MDCGFVARADIDPEDVGPVAPHQGTFFDAAFGDCGEGAGWDFHWGITPALPCIIASSPNFIAIDGRRTTISALP